METTVPVLPSKTPDSTKNILLAILIISLIANLILTFLLFQSNKTQETQKTQSTESPAEEIPQNCTEYKSPTILSENNFKTTSGRITENDELNKVIIVKADEVFGDLTSNLRYSSNTTFYVGEDIASSDNISEHDRIQYVSSNNVLSIVAYIEDCP